MKNKITLNILFSLSFILIGLLCSCGNKSQSEKAQTNKSESKNVISIETVTYEEIEEDGVDLSGCSCTFSRNKEEYMQGKYVYLDDFGGSLAVMKINNKIVVFEVISDEDTDYDLTVTTGKSSEYKLHITKEFIDNTGHETHSFKGVIKLTDKEGKSIQQEYWGICGC